MQAKIDALYGRLSKEDLQAGESESIQQQKKILQKYAEEHHFYNTRFYIDDGVSGVSFEREGLKQMLADVEAGLVRTVIVKDLSRLGRNYLKTGELIEIVFPEKGVRFIAIADGVDTVREDNDFTPLRNWFNEFYARDTSKKIRTVKNAQAQRGERVNGSYPYGYRVDPADRNHLLPDPETAPAIRQMFAMYTQGARVCDIQRWLESNGIGNPTEMHYRRGEKPRHPRPAPECACQWTQRSIYDILARQEYRGHTVTAKTQKVSYKSHKTLRNPEEKRCFFENTHEPLIDEATFDLAQKRIATRHRPTRSNEIDMFSGLLFCADCGAKMQLQRGQTEAYVCGNYRSHKPGCNCTIHYIRRELLLDLVLTDLQRVLSYARENERDFTRRAAEHGDREAQKALSAQRRELEKANLRLKELDTLFRKLYEDNALGRLSDTQFAMLTSGYDEETAALASKKAALEQALSTAQSRKVNTNKFLKLVRNYSDVQELSYENLHDFIDRIIIHATDKETKTRTIEILYSFVGQVQGGEPVRKTQYARKLGGRAESIVI